MLRIYQKEKMVIMNKEIENLRVDMKLLKIYKI